MTTSQWQDTLAKPDQKIHDAIAILDNSSAHIVLVVDEAGTLLGTLTDGDIRRAILRGCSLDLCIDTIMNATPVVAAPEANRQQILALMQQYHLRQIPIVDEAQKVVGLSYYYDILASNDRDNIVVIMAGGLGQRLQPLTDNCPKPMLHIGGKPILETIISNLAEKGLSQFYISVNYRSEMICEHFKDGAEWGVNIEYLKEPMRMGTAGALSLLPKQTQKTILVMNGDILTKVNVERLFDFHQGHASKATMCVREYDYRVPYGVVRLDDRYYIKEVAEKPLQRFFVNAGIYALEPDVLNAIPKDHYIDMPTLFEQLRANDERVAAFPIREYWLDIGRHSDFAKAEIDFESVFQ